MTCGIGFRLIFSTDSNESVLTILFQRCYLCYQEYHKAASLVGPLLFILYINDFPSLLKELLPFLFADDTKCIHTAKTAEDFNIIQEDLNIASNWSVLHNLSFNCSRCAVLHFWCNNNSTAQYFLNNNNIESTELIKDLGIMISTDLSWSAHCNMVVSRAYKQLGLIRRSFTTNCTLTKKQLYISLVRSQLMYCSQIWRPNLVQDIQLLERVQRRATKYILMIILHPIKLDY